MITAIILEDEKNTAQVLKRMLETYPDVNVAAICLDIKEAEDAINTFHPDLVFLDIELGKSQTSFDLLTKISPIHFDIIFTTAYNHYAMQAIKLSAVDYLLKPIDKNELDAAIAKFLSKKSRTDSHKIESLLSAWSNPGSQLNKMPLPTMTGYDLVTISDIIYCEGVSSQTLLILNNQKETLISVSLKECEDLLTPYRFYRIHKSYLVNLNHVKKYIKGKDGTVIMSNNASLTVSRTLKDNFIERLKKF